MSREQRIPRPLGPPAAIRRVSGRICVLPMVASRVAVRTMPRDPAGMDPVAAPVSDADSWRGVADYSDDAGAFAA